MNQTDAGFHYLEEILDIESKISNTTDTSNKSVRKYRSIFKNTSNDYSYEDADHKTNLSNSSYMADTKLNPLNSSDSKHIHLKNRKRRRKSKTIESQQKDLDFLKYLSGSTNQTDGMHQKRHGRKYANRKDKKLIKNKGSQRWKWQQTRRNKIHIFTRKRGSQRGSSSADSRRLLGYSRMFGRWEKWTPCSFKCTTYRIK